MSIADIIGLSFENVRDTEYLKFDFDLIEYICVVCFTLELVFRFLICPNRTKFAKTIFNIIDLLSVIPFYIYISVPANGIVLKMKIFSRILRIISTIRLFKHLDQFLTIRKTMIKSVSELSIYICYLSIGVLIFSSLLWTVEYEEPGTKYTSIPASFWWAVIKFFCFWFFSHLQKTEEVYKTHKLKLKKLLINWWQKIIFEVFCRFFTLFGF